ncbi:DEAD/DEAH box helicase [Microbacterium oxydans]|uniref:DEAD/DEAH box helicase n=1 Tax=Microbacterium oxydans TaxID=82380 RepID=UPI0024AD3A5C|nr:DEAD/DEAH box helicase family protein [Microbacterium oxydans]
MKIPLKGFQKKRVRRVLRALDDAYRYWDEDSDRSAVMLVAPTGSGKTVIATEVIEGLLEGSTEAVERPTLRVLWLTDSPSLNRQSADKMDRYGDLLAYGKNLVVVDEGYDEYELTPGTVTFAHIQQLTRSASSWWPNEARGKSHALWHAIARTVREHGDDFLLVIDEAHKGIGSDSGQSDRDTIIKTCLEGGTNLFDGSEHPAAPVALVMTATPQRFKDAMVSSDRRTPEEKVDVADVQAEGLLKPRVRVEFSKENQKAHHTLLESGAEDLYVSEKLWAEAEAGGFQRVVPALVVQVENSISKGELGQRMKTISDKWAELTGAELPERAFAHAFGDDGDIDTGNGLLRKVAAEQIEADSWIRVVIFKEALSTGWDCPRAEVMVSLRPATDSTKIAQLVGRMIRTPGATHAPDPRLESVMLYLPYYDQAAVKKVVDEIAKDSDGAVTVELETAVTQRNPQVSDEIYAKVNRLPKYTKPKQDYPNDVERASDLAEALVDRGVVEIVEGEEIPEDILRARLVAEMKRLETASKSQITKRVEDLLQIDTLRQDFTYAGVTSNEEAQTDERKKSVHARDLDGYFEEAKRRLPGGTGAWYYEALVAAGTSGKRAKMRVAALSETADIAGLLNSVAAEQVAKMQKEYEDLVDTLGLSSHFKAIWYPPRKPVDGHLELSNPGRVATQRARKKGTEILYERFPLLERHIWAFENNGAWVYPGSINAWEAAALALELTPERKVVGWYRNPGSGAAALSVPYYKQGALALLHPDFIFVREIDGELVIDIVDPHLDHGDSRDKWKGLGWYAAQHADIIRRAIAVVRIGETDWGLDLARQDVRDALENADEPLNVIFERLGHKRVAN